MKPQILPDITRPDVGVVMVSGWTVGTPERQQATVEAWISALKRIPWPEGLLSANFFTDIDGETVLNYGQWISMEAFEEFVRTRPRSLAEAIDRAVPGIERKPPVAYRLHSSGIRNDAPSPGCIVIPGFEVDGPEQQKQLADWLATQGPAIANSHPGLISAHLHISLDGTRVLNYAEWTDERAHSEFVESASSAERRRAIDNMPGVRFLGFKRYRFAGSLVADEHQEAA